jgi:hypothetical protein
MTLFMRHALGARDAHPVTHIFARRDVPGPEHSLAELLKCRPTPSPPMVQVSINEEPFGKLCGRPLNAWDLERIRAAAREADPQQRAEIAR